jgi:hypothetical protein
MERRYGEAHQRTSDNERGNLESSRDLRARFR